jgi:hypothetical protein
MNEPNATAYNEAVKLSHLKTVGTCVSAAERSVMTRVLKTGK